jgi:hypothetical protein
MKGGPHNGTEEEAREEEAPEAGSTEADVAEKPPYPFGRAADFKSRISGFALLSYGFSPGAPGLSIVPLHGFLCRCLDADRLPGAGYSDRK